MRDRLLRWSSMVLAMALLASACGGEPQPEALKQGRSVYADTCAACHGSAGQGGVGPALAGVVETWPSCTDQVEWISLGSDGWRDAHGDTYGANARSVEGGMPEHASRLTPQEIALVAVFERVQYGDEPFDTAVTGCGLG